MSSRYNRHWFSCDTMGNIKHCRFCKSVSIFSLYNNLSKATKDKWDIDRDIQSFLHMDTYNIQCFSICHFRLWYCRSSCNSCTSMWSRLDSTVLSGTRRYPLIWRLPICRDRLSKGSFVLDSCNFASIASCCKLSL